MNQKVAIYIRVSTVHQIDKESLPFQRRELSNYCKYALGIDDYEIFEDAGYSGKNTQRPAFAKMMIKLKAGNFTHLLVWKIDRISRNLIDFITMFNELKKYDIIFLSKNEQFDTSSAIGEATLKLIMIFAELERNLTSERVTDVMISKATKGDWNGGRIPYGYDYDKKSKIFSINLKESSIVKLIYDYYIETKSMTKVANYLRENNIKNRNNNFFTVNSIQLILSSVFYIGTYRYNYRKGGARNQTKPEEDWIDNVNHHPAIIHEEQYNEVSKIRDINKKLMNAKKKLVNKKNVNIFSGLLTCVCGGNLKASPANVQASGYRPSKYGCYNKTIGKCKNSYVSDPYLGNFTLNFVSNLYKAYNSFGKTTTLTTFTNKVLRGKLFENIEKVEGLENIYDKFKENCQNTNIFFKEVLKSTNSAKYIDNASQLDILSNEQAKYTRALERLKNLYLFSDSAISESDYLQQKLQLESNLEKIEESLNNSKEKQCDNLEFIKLASCFILNQNLESKREIDFVKLAMSIDTRIIQNFVRDMFQNFCIKDGKIIKLTLKNDITITFFYK